MTMCYYLLQLELFFSVNILQFIFLALRLDNFIHWSWGVSTKSCLLPKIKRLKCKIYVKVIVTEWFRHIFGHSLHIWRPRKNSRLCYACYSPSIYVYWQRFSIWQLNMFGTKNICLCPNSFVLFVFKWPTQVFHNTWVPFWASHTVARIYVLCRIHNNFTK